MPTPRTATRRDQEYYVLAEQEACEHLHAPGALRSFLRRCDRRGVVLLLEAATREQVIAMLDELPTVAMGAAMYRTFAVEAVTAEAIRLCHL